LPPQVVDRIIRAVERYRVTGHGDVTKLAGPAAEYRLRVGDWRVRFDYDDATNHLTILHVLPRGRAYRD
jgi:mRNA interferase RelE/StbE